MQSAQISCLSNAIRFINEYTIKCMILFSVSIVLCSFFIFSLTNYRTLSGRKIFYFLLNRTSKNESAALAGFSKVKKSIPIGTTYHIYNN